MERVSELLDFEAAAAIAPFLRVKFTAPGVVGVAGDEACIGTLRTRSYAAGDRVTVVDKRAPGTRTMIAGGAIAKGAAVTSAAGGKVVTGTAGVEDYGVALTAAAGDGEQLEVMLSNL